MWGHGLDRSSGLGYGQVVDTSESGNEPLDSTKCKEFLD